MSTQLALREAALDLAEVDLAVRGENVEKLAWADLVQAAPLWLRISMGMVAEENQGVLLLASREIHSLLFNRVIGLGQSAPATDRQISDLMDRYWTLGISNYWVHAGPYAHPPRLGRMLHAHGLSLYRRSWVKMMRPAHHVHTSPSQIRIRRATFEDAHAVASIVGPAFDLGQRAAELFTNLIDRPRWSVLVAELDAQIIGAAGLFVDGEMGYLAFAATRPEFRGLGTQRALMQARINLANEAGCSWIATETGFPLAADEPNPSYHNMLWAGFRPVEIRDNYAPPGTQWKRMEEESELDGQEAG
jgi:GNAT superfamily N-acetyltransferase